MTQGDLVPYAESFSCAHLDRDRGVLTVRLHTNDGPLVWSRTVHRELPLLFEAIGADQQNRVLVVVGTGSSFCDAIEPYEVPGGEPPPRPGLARGGIPADLWNVTYSEGKRLLQRWLDLDIPVIAAVNGPAHIHSELPMLADIVLAAPSASFADSHIARGLVPGDGVNVTWSALLGPNRARFHLLTSEPLSAAEAHRLGVVSAIVPADQLLDRARAMARTLAALPPLVTRYSRVVLTNDLRARMASELGYGLALEGLAVSAGRGPWDEATPLRSAL